VNDCIGDTGGPLVQLGNNEGSDVLVGVTSKAVGDCSRGGLPGLFVDVAHIKNWIESII